MHPFHKRQGRAERAQRFSNYDPDSTLPPGPMLKQTKRCLCSGVTSAVIARPARDSVASHILTRNLTPKAGSQECLWPISHPWCLKGDVPTLLFCSNYSQLTGAKIKVC